MSDKDHHFWIPFHVVACSSEEPGTNVELLSTNNTYSEKSWESSRTSDYPIELIIRFHYRIQIENVFMASKPEKHIPEIQFHIGDGLTGSFVDAEYRESGYSILLKNKNFYFSKFISEIFPLILENWKILPIKSRRPKSMESAPILN